MSNEGSARWMRMLFVIETEVGDSSSTVFSSFFLSDLLGLTVESFFFSDSCFDSFDDEAPIGSLSLLMRLAGEEAEVLPRNRSDVGSHSVKS